MHRLLERQLRKNFGKTDGLPPEVQRFVEAIDDAYRQADADRAMLERSMELSSRELVGRNEELALAERKYRAIFENSTEGIFQSTRGGRVISANPALAHIFGYDSPEHLKASVTNLAEQHYFDSEQRAKVIQSIPPDGSPYRYEAQAKRRDGTVIWTSIVIRAVLDEHGQLEFYEGTLSDITTRKRAETEREELQSRLMTMSRQAGMAEVATGVLHNVGNVLNSINVSVTLATERIRNSKLPNLARAAGMLRDHSPDITNFLAQSEKGRQLPEYLVRLSEHLASEHEQVLGELSSLVENVEHVKRIVAMQQGYARVSGVHEAVVLPELIEDALRMNAASFGRHKVQIEKDFQPLPPINVDKHRVLQILLNLVSNAKHALRDVNAERKLTIRIGLSPQDSGRVFIQVRDTGVGIAKENLTRIFGHGFTTKEDGHGFGLHSSALAAKLMSGSLVAESEGPGTGATFTLELPLTATAQQQPPEQQSERVA